MAERRSGWGAQKRHALDALAEEILQSHGRGRTIVAVDGNRGSGTAQFAAALLEALQAADCVVFHASMDDFQQPRAQQDGDPSAPGYDYSLLRRVLIDPYRMAGSTGFALRGFDAARDEPIFQPKWKSAGADAVLLVDGMFLHRPELADTWNYSIWVESSAVEDEVAAAYRAAVGPTAVATAVVDNSDPDNPRRVFANPRWLVSTGWFFRIG